VCISVVALQLKTKKDFDKNLQNLIKKIKKVSNDSFVVAPELLLSGYAYDRFDEAVSITKKAIKELTKLSIKKTISITMITKQNGSYYNTFYIFYKGKIVHTQSKYKLFVLNDEKKYFASGAEEDIKVFRVGELKVATLICFELRFIDLWKKLQGADIIIIPAMWGVLRKENLETLSRALAVMNQCFVVVSNSANSDMAKSSGIITPFGVECRDDSKKIISQVIDLKEIKKMRRYMNVGIKR